jgi:ribosomal-protein-alanine N-acetyltransferase
MEGKKIYLRKLAEEDCVGNYLLMVNDAETTKYLEGLGHRHLAVADLVEYVTSTNQSDSDLLFGVFEIQSNAHVGNVHLSNIKLSHGNCNFGIVMNRAYAGKGYALEASFMLAKHAFTNLNIHRLSILVVDANKSARTLYERLGAKAEGIMREAIFKNNKFFDLVMYGLLKQDLIELSD